MPARNVVLKRGKVILIIYGICCIAVVSFLVPILSRGDYGLLNFLLAWLVVQLGPLYSVGLIVLHHSSEMMLIDWLAWITAVVLPPAAILAYLFRPATKVHWLNSLLSVVTAVISFIGLVIWLLFGLVFGLGGYW